MADEGFQKVQGKVLLDLFSPAVDYMAHNPTII